jgi:deoxyribonuclease-4
MLGCHLSVAGGLHNALIQAHQFHFEALQIFTKNQRQWAAPPLTAQQVAQWQAAWKQAPGVRQVVSHDSYLINLASPGGDVRSKSIALFRDEIQRCEALGISCLVAHPGSHLNEGEAAGLARIIDALNEIHDALPGYSTVTCLENTAGQGTNLGYDLKHLRVIIDGVKEPQRLAVCIDTAHSLEAGYDLTSAAGARGFIDELEAVVGLHRVRVMHVNDSKTERGSRVDRHAHIGFGHVAGEALSVLLREPRLAQAPKIVESPEGEAEDGRSWDEVDVEALRKLAGV